MISSSWADTWRGSSTIVQNNFTQTEVKIFHALNVGKKYLLVSLLNTTTAMILTFRVRHDKDTLIVVNWENILVSPSKNIWLIQCTRIAFMNPCWTSIIGRKTVTMRCLGQNSFYIGISDDELLLLRYWSKLLHIPRTWIRPESCRERKDVFSF